MGYTAYLLSHEARQTLQTRFPPKYPEQRAEHATVAFGVGPNAPLPEVARIEVIGYADDGQGIEAAVLRVNGKTQRPDGEFYHVTLSYDPEKQAPLGFNPWGSATPMTYRAMHSKGLVAAGCYTTPIDPPFEILATPVYLADSAEKIHSLEAHVSAHYR